MIDRQRALPSPDISIVVPVYGLGESLPSLVERAAATFASPPRPWEIIFVNDGGPLPAWDVISRLASVHPQVRGIDLLRNFGQQNALLAGIRASRGDVVVTMDDDLQHPPEEVPRLIERLATADLVYGTPTERVRGWFRNVAARLSKAALATVVGAGHARDIGAFRAFRGSLRRVFADYDSPNVSIDVLLSWATTRIVAVPVTYDRRQQGRSGYTPRALVRLTVNMVTGFSVWPLRMASVVGLACAAFGLVVLGFVILRYVTAGAAVPGFAFLASIIAIFSGAQLFSLGVLGEYLARMYFRTMDRPAYLIRTTTDAPLRGDR